MAFASAFAGLRLPSVAAPGHAGAVPRTVTTMAKKKGVRVIVTLECTEARALGKPPSRYTTQKVRMEEARGW